MYNKFPWQHPIHSYHKLFRVCYNGVIWVLPLLYPPVTKGIVGRNYCTDVCIVLNFNIHQVWQPVSQRYGTWTGPWIGGSLQRVSQISSGSWSCILASHSGNTSSLMLALAQKPRYWKCQWIWQSRAPKWGLFPYQCFNGCHSPSFQYVHIWSCLYNFCFLDPGFRC